MEGVKNEEWGMGNRIFLYLGEGSPKPVVGQRRDDVYELLGHRVGELHFM